MKRTIIIVAFVFDRVAIYFRHTFYLSLEFVQVQLGANESLKWAHVGCVDPQGNLISCKVKERFGQLSCRLLIGWVIVGKQIKS